MIPMKTNPSFKIFKFSTLAPLGIAITAAFVTQPVFGQSFHQLVFTENSSSSLSATFDGTPLTVTPTLIGFPDEWDVTPPTGVSIPGLLWFEPGTTSFINFAGRTFLGNQLHVVSDTIGFGSIEPNGFTYVGVSIDTSDGVPIDVTFNDKGDVAAVPDRGSTFGLLFLSLIGLLGATRLRSLQLA
jgi:hypothetical protein